MTAPASYRRPIADVLAPVTALVPHLRWRVGTPDPTAAELASRDLVDHPGHLSDAVRATAAGRGSDDPQVLASLWWQAYAYRVAGTTLAAWLLAGGAPDPSLPTGVGVGVARHRPAAVIYGPGASVITDLVEVVVSLFSGHLDQLGASLRDVHRVGEALVWGNCAAGIASALGAVEAAEGAPPVRDRIQMVTEALPHDLAAAGAWSQSDDGWHYRRHSCCLWWKTDASAGTYCEDCSLIGRDAAAGEQP